MLARRRKTIQNVRFARVKAPQKIIDLLDDTRETMEDAYSNVNKLIQMKEVSTEARTALRRLLSKISETARETDSVYLNYFK